MAGRVCLGVIIGAHGLRGLVRIRPFTELAENVAAYGPVESEDGARQLTLAVANRAGKGQIVVRVDGIADREGAEALKGMHLYVSRDRLPAPASEEFYHADLVGLAVIDGQGGAVGKVRAVHNFGGGDIVEIEREDGAVVTVAFTRAAVPRVDLAAGHIVVDTDALLEASGP